jgi:hypothetical protein
MQNLLFMVIGFPLFSFMIIGSFGRFLGLYGSMLVGVLNMCGALLCSILLFFNTSFDVSLYVEL